jgi:hypothetical protein
MRGHLGLLLCAILLAGCSSLMGGDPPPPPAPDPLPNARQILLNSTDALFDPTANARNLAISEVRQVDTAAGPRQGVCLRAFVSNRQGKPLGNVIYVVVFDHNKVVERRRALPSDACDKERYQPL